MFGIPVYEHAFVHGNNQSVLSNTTLPQSTLKKKSQSIALHFFREGCASDEWHTAYINTALNAEYLMTKTLSGEKKWRFIKILVHHI